MKEARPQKPANISHFIGTSFIPSRSHHHHHQNTSKAPQPATSRNCGHLALTHQPLGIAKRVLTYYTLPTIYLRYLVIRLPPPNDLVLDSNCSFVLWAWFCHTVAATPRRNLTSHSGLPVRSRPYFSIPSLTLCRWAIGPSSTLLQREHCFGASRAAMSSSLSPDHAEGSTSRASTEGTDKGVLSSLNLNFFKSLSDKKVTRSKQSRTCCRPRRHE